MSSVLQKTEIGEIPEDWNVVEIGDVFKFTSGKTKPKDTQPIPTDAQNIPVYGGNGILGYTTQHLLEESTLILGRVGEYCGCAHLTAPISWVTDNALYTKEEKIPVNRCFVRDHFEYLNLNKYSNKMGQPLITQGIINRVKFALPPLPEQKKIAHILSTVQRAIETQERIIQTTTELKKALMHKLFTEGLRNEPQKQTEIGPVPESWGVVTVQDLVDRDILDKPIDGNHGEIHPKVADFVSEGIPFIMASDLKGGLVDLKTCNFLTKERADRLRKGFSLPGDVLISHKATIGETAIVPEVEHYIMLTPQVTYYRVLDRDALSNEYLRCYFDSPAFQKPLKNVAGDGSTRAYIGITKQRGLPVLLPKIDEQRELADISGRLDEKIRQAIAKKNAFSQLFSTLLHELMTAKTRVHNLEITA